MMFFMWDLSGSRFVTREELATMLHCMVRIARSLEQCVYAPRGLTERMLLVRRSGIGPTQDAGSGRQYVLRIQL